MADVEVVIKIPEDLYKGIERRDGALETEYVCDELMKAVDNGTPLPKGHGRLIDADVLKTAFPCGESVRTECVRATIDYVTTIIEADNAESEE